MGQTMMGAVAGAVKATSTHAAQPPSFCIDCGTALPEHAKFCPACGKGL
jgi:hypothetical protein